MAVLIKDDEADALIRTLAKRTGTSMTDAVKEAVREQLKRVPLSEAEIAERCKKVAAIIAAFDAMPTLDHRTPDEIIGYNKDGLFD
jgi:antitoxin VapB